MPSKGRKQQFWKKPSLPLWKKIATKSSNVYSYSQFKKLAVPFIGVTRFGWTIKKKSLKSILCLCVQFKCDLPPNQSRKKIGSDLHLCPGRVRCCWDRASALMVPVSPSNHSCPAVLKKWFFQDPGHGHWSACFPPKLCLERQKFEISASEWNLSRIFKLSTELADFQ